MVIFHCLFTIVVSYIWSLEITLELGMHRVASRGALQTANLIC